MTNRSRTGIEPSVTFFTKRVSKSDEHDWKKLKRIMTWLRKTKSNVKIIGAKNIEDPHACVDGLFSVHGNMRIHVGVLMKFGHGIVHLNQ